MGVCATDLPPTATALSGPRLFAGGNEERDEDPCRNAVLDTKRLARIHYFSIHIALFIIQVDRVRRLNCVGALATDGH